MDLTHFLKHNFTYREFPVQLHLSKPYAEIDLSRTFSTICISVQLPDGRNNRVYVSPPNEDVLWTHIYNAIRDAMTNTEREEQRQRAYQEQQRLEAIRQDEIARAEYLLVKLSFNWADEIDFEGWKAMTQQGWQDLKQTIASIDYPYEHYVGSNEEKTWETETELLNDYNPRPITQAQYQVLMELFGGQSGEWLDFEDTMDDED